MFLLFLQVPSYTRDQFFSSLRTSLGSGAVYDAFRGGYISRTPSGQISRFSPVSNYYGGSVSLPTAYGSSWLPKYSGAYTSYQATPSKSSSSAIKSSSTLYGETRGNTYYPNPLAQPGGIVPTLSKAELATFKSPVQTSQEYIQTQAFKNLPVSQQQAFLNTSASTTKSAPSVSFTPPPVQAPDLLGSSGNDLLTGLAGKTQTLRGGKGDDTYRVDSAFHHVHENPGEGIDTIVLSVDGSIGLRGYGNVENLVLAGAARNGIGNDLNNKIQGNNLGNYLDGLNGVDVLTGLGGADIFALSTSPAFGKSSADHLTDFNSSEGDSLRISKAAFGIGSADIMSGVKTVYGPAELQAALGSAETFVYDRGLGELYFNQNGALAGAGNGGVFAIFDNKSALSSISLVA